MLTTTNVYEFKKNILKILCLQILVQLKNVKIASVRCNDWSSNFDPSILYV
jgi:hypothetical protein